MDAKKRKRKKPGHEPSSVSVQTSLQADDPSARNAVVPKALGKRDNMPDKPSDDGPSENGKKTSGKPDDKEKNGPGKKDSGHGDDKNVRDGQDKADAKLNGTMDRHGNNSKGRPDDRDRRGKGNEDEDAASGRGDKRGKAGKDDKSGKPDKAADGDKPDVNPDGTPGGKDNAKELGKAGGKPGNTAGQPDLSEDAGKSAEGAKQLGDTAGKAAGAAEGAQAAAGEAAPGITPQDVKDMKNLDVKDDMKDLKDDLRKGDLNAVAENETARKALDVAAKETGNPYVIAANEALKLNDELKKHGGGVDLNAAAQGKIDPQAAAKNAKALKEVAKDKAGMGDGGDGDGVSEDDINDDIGDSDGSEYKDEGEGKPEDEDNKDSEDEKDTPDGDDDGSIGDDEEGKDDEEDEKAKELGKKIALQAASGTGNAVAAVAPYVLIVKAAYAFAQMLYMLMMSIIQLAAKAVMGFFGWLINLGMTIWNGITAIGSGIASFVGASASAVQSFVTGAATVAVGAVVCVAAVFSVRYYDELTQMMATEKGVTLSVGCTESEKGFWGKLKEGLTNDPVSGLSDMQKQICLETIAALKAGGHCPSTAYAIGVLADMYAESELDPLRIGGKPAGTYVGGDILKSESEQMVLKSKDKLNADNKYVLYSMRDKSYNYGIGLFQILACRDGFLNYCYAAEGGLTSLPAEEGEEWENFSDAWSAGEHWFTSGAQLSFMKNYPVDIAFFNTDYDPTMLAADGIENIEEYDYSDVHVGHFSGEPTDAQKSAMYASTLFLGTYERPVAYVTEGEDRDYIIAKRAQIALSIYQKLADDGILTHYSHYSDWAAGVMSRIASSSVLATIDAVQSGYTNCGISTAMWDLDSPAAVSTTFSNPEHNDFDEANPSTIYKYIVNTIGPSIGDSLVGDNLIGSCDRNIAYAYIVSGWDPDIVIAFVGDQRAYYESSDRWEKVVDWLADDPPTADEMREILCPGDVFVDYSASSDGQHTYMYVSNEMVLAINQVDASMLSEPQNQVYADKEITEASFGVCFPHLGRLSLFRAGNGCTNTAVYRCVNPVMDGTYRDLVRYGIPEEDEEVDGAEAA